MIYPVCSIRDSKISFYPPTVEENKQAAIRNFAMAINNSTGLLGFAPGDFTLFHIADFDNEKGEITSIWPVEQLVSGLDVFSVADEK